MESDVLTASVGSTNDSADYCNPDIAGQYNKVLNNQSPKCENMDYSSVSLPLDYNRESSTISHDDSASDVRRLIKSYSNASRNSGSFDETNKFTPPYRNKKRTSNISLNLVALQSTTQKPESKTKLVLLEEENTISMFSLVSQSQAMTPCVKRPVWGLLQLLGVTLCFVGPHMIWTFPAFVHVNSGAILIPFYIGLLFIVLPIMYVQMRLGGSTRSNLISIFSKYCPVLKGIGVASVIRLFLISIYFNIIVAYNISFATSSLEQPYPWSKCDGGHNLLSCDNSKSNFSLTADRSETQFFERGVLSISDDISEEGGLPLNIAACLVAAWAITFFLIIGGMKWFGWNMFLLGSIAVIVSIALLSYGREELSHTNPELPIYKADWSVLWSRDKSIAESFLTSWVDGIFQAIMISKIWDGILPTIGKNCGKGVLRTNSRWVLIFFGLLILPHLFIFLISCYMGALAGVSGMNLDQVLLQGPEEGHILMFVNFPMAFNALGIKRGVAFCFYFVMIIFTAMAQALWSIVAVENIADSVKHIEALGKCQCKKPVWYIASATLYCLAGLVLAIPLARQGGLYVVHLLMGWLDRLFCVVILFSFIAFTVSYAKQRYHIVNKVLILLWFVIASLLSIGAMIYKGGLMDFEYYTTFTRFIQVGSQYAYPEWAVILGWCIAGGFIVIGLIFGLIHAIFMAPGYGAGQKCASACLGESSEPMVVPRNDDHKRKSKYTSVEEEGYLSPISK